MPTILAAIDDSAATGPVVEVAQWFAALVDLDVLALHVSGDGDGLTAHAIADAAGVDFELRAGDPVATICDAAAEPEVRALAIGARGLPTHGMPAGHVALDLIGTVAKPVIVVPPDVRVPRDGRLRVLAPVDEDPRSAAALQRLLEEMHPPGLEVVLLRVFDAEHMPKFANHGTYDADIFVEGLVRRTVPSEVAARTRVEMRVGYPAHTILAVERELEFDVVVLGWGQDLVNGRASTVRRLLAHAKTPVILLPAHHRLDTAQAQLQRAGAR
jgi:Universal stress protein family